MSDSNLLPINIEVMAGAMPLLIALALARFVPIARAYHPLTFFAALCQRVIAKVSRNDEHAGQQKLAGTLATWVLLIPAMLIFGVLQWLSAFPLILESLLLWLLIDIEALKRDCQSIERACTQNKKHLARKLSAPWLLREIDALSVMGLRKANTETLILRFNQAYLAVIIYALLVHPLFALFYRLVIVINQNSNAKLSQYRHFARHSQWLRRVLDFLPALVTNLLLLTYGWMHKNNRVPRGKVKFRQQQDALLERFAYACHCRLGGPVIYRGIKVRRPVLAGNLAQPNQATLSHAVKVISYLQQVLLSSILLGYLAWWTLIWLSPT